MPDNSFACVFHLDGKVAVGGTADEVVVAHGPVAVKAETPDVNGEDITRHRGLDEEGASLGVAAHNALLAVEVVATSVDGGGVDGVAGVDGEDGLVEGGELAIEDGRSEVVTLGWGRRAGRTLGGGEGEAGGFGGRDAIGLDDLALEGVIDDGAFDLLDAAVSVFGEEVESGAIGDALERITAEFAGELVALLDEVEAVVGRRAVVVEDGGPVAGESGLRVACLRLCEWCQKSKSQAKGNAVSHEASSMRGYTKNPG